MSSSTNAGNIEYSKYTLENEGSRINGLVGGVAPMGQRFVPQNHITVSEPLEAPRSGSDGGDSNAQQNISEESWLEQTDKLYRSVYNKDMMAATSTRLADGYVPAWFTSNRSRLAVLTRNYLEGLEREQLPVDRRQMLDRLDMKVSAPEVMRMRVNAGLE